VLDVAKLLLKKTANSAFCETTNDRKILAIPKINNKKQNQQTNKNKQN
jgi:hypothetical protein